MMSPNVHAYAHEGSRSTAAIKTLLVQLDDTWPSLEQHSTEGGEPLPRPATALTRGAGALLTPRYREPV